MAFFGLSDLSKPKYIVAIISDIANGNLIAVRENGITKKIKIEFDSTLKKLQTVQSNEREYKKILYKNGKHQPIFKEKGKRTYYKFTQIDKSPYSKMGGNTNSLGKKLADAGEKATIEAIKLFIKNKRILKPEDTGEKIFIENPSAFSDWLHTFNETPKAIKEIVSGSLHSFEYIHDATSGNKFQPIVDKIVKVHGGSKDSWNPADLWIIKKTKFNSILNNFHKILDSKMSDSEKLTASNEYFKKLYDNGELYPISLKQIIRGSKYKIELSNYEKTNYHYDFEMSDFPCDFSLDSNQNWNTKEIGGFRAKNLETGKTLEFQVRGFPHGYTTAQTEITKSGDRSGGRVGKIPTKEIDRIMASYGGKRISSIRQLKDMNWDRNDIKQYADMFKDLDGSKHFENHIHDWLKRCDVDYDFKATFAMKIQGLVISHFLYKNKKDISTILTGFLLAAKKISNDSGFFIKVY